MWRANNLEKKRATDAAYYAANKERLKAQSSVYYAANREDGRKARRNYRKKNADCLRQYDAIRYDRNPERALRSARARRARKNGADGSYNQTDIDRIVKAQRNRCAYCRTKLTGGAHIDHIKPLSKGGSNFPANLQLLCATCNLTKHAADPLDYARRIGKLL